MKKKKKKKSDQREVRGETLKRVQVVPGAVLEQPPSE
jgi:hypothetical protein